MSKGQKTAYVQQVSNGFIVKFDTEGDYGESTYTFVYPTMEEVTGALEGWFVEPVGYPALGEAL